MEEAHTLIQSLKTALAHAELAHGEALAAERAAREQVQTALQAAIADREAAEQKVAAAGSLAGSDRKAPLILRYARNDGPWIAAPCGPIPLGRLGGRRKHGPRILHKAPEREPRSLVIGQHHRAARPIADLLDLAATGSGAGLP